MGTVLGASTAVGWFYSGVESAVAAIQQSSWGVPVLYATCALAMAAFAAKNVYSWWEERQEQMELQEMGGLGAPTRSEALSEMPLLEQLEQQHQNGLQEQQMGSPVGLGAVANNT